MPRLPVDRWRLYFSVTQQALIPGLSAYPGMEPHRRAGGISEWRDSFVPTFRGDACFLPEERQGKLLRTACQGPCLWEPQASPLAVCCGSLRTADSQVELLQVLAWRLPCTESLVPWIWLFLDDPRPSPSLGKCLGQPRLWSSPREARPVGL